MQGLRRAFLKAAGRSWSRSPRAASDRGRRRARPTKSVDPDEVGGFLAIDAKGMVRCTPARWSSAPACSTAITQIAAEELSVPFDRVTTIQGDTVLTPNQGPTFASLSIQDGGMQIRRAAATAREALLDEAARKLGIGEADARRSRRRRRA